MLVSALQRLLVGLHLYLHQQHQSSAPRSIRRLLGLHWGGGTNYLSNMFYFQPENILFSVGCFVTSYFRESGVLAAVHKVRHAREGEGPRACDVTLIKFYHTYEFMKPEI